MTDRSEPPDTAARAHGRLGTPEHLVRAGGVEPPPAESATRIERPWGYEVVWAETTEYGGRLLHVRAGEALPIELHDERDETLFLLRGEVVVELGPGLSSLRSVPLGEGLSVRIRPGVLHRVSAVTDATLLEASSGELDDVVEVRVPP